MTDLSQAIWRKARRSAHNGGCVEIAANLDGVTAVRITGRDAVHAGTDAAPGPTAGT